MISGGEFGWPSFSDRFCHGLPVIGAAGKHAPDHPAGTGGRRSAIVASAVSSLVNSCARISLPAGSTEI